MVELLEYHGWAVLCSRHRDWSDDDWGYVRSEVEAALAALREEDGHAAHINWPANGGSVVALNGWADSADAPLQVLRRIGEVAPDSYAELVVFPTAEPTSGQAVRYRMREGLVKEA